MNTRYQLTMLALAAVAERCATMADLCLIASREGSSPIATSHVIDKMIAGMPQLRRDLDTARRNFNLAIDTGATDHA